MYLKALKRTGMVISINIPTLLHNTVYANMFCKMLPKSDPWDRLRHYVITPIIRDVLKESSHQHFSVMSKHKGQNYI